MNTFTSNILTLYKEKGTQWLDNLPTLIEEIAKKWKLSHLTPLQNLSFNYILSGFQGDIPIILKLGLNEEELCKEATVLQAYHGKGAIKLLDQAQEALLLQRAFPGTSLKTCSLSPIEKLNAACTVMDQIHSAYLSSTQLPSIVTWLQILDQSWNLPEGLLESARLYRDQLLPLYTKKVLLHGDLHQENMLQHQQGWLAIDPKGVVGDPIHELWAFIMDPIQDIPYLAHRYGFDIAHLRKCYFVHVILRAVWCLEDGFSPELFLHLANKIVDEVDK